MLKYTLELIPMFNRKSKKKQPDNYSSHVNSDFCEALDPSTVIFSNTILSKCHRYKIDTNEQSFQIDMQAYFKQPAGNNLIELTVLANGFRSKVVLYAAELISWLPAPCHLLMDDAPLDMMETAIALALPKLSTVLQQFDIIDLKILNLDQFAPKSEKTMGICVSVNDGTKKLSLFIEKCEHLAALIDQLPKPSLYQRSSIPLTLQFVIGTTQLTLKEINLLEEGDIVLFTKYYWQNHETLIYLESTLLGSAIEKNDTMVLTNQELCMGSKSDDNLAGTLAKMELDIYFSMGKTRVPLAELLNLQEGYVFDLKRDNYSSIDMKVNDVTIAKCQLVSISGKIGAKIVHTDTSMLNAELSELKQKLSNNTTVNSNPPVLEEYHDD